MVKEGIGIAYFTPLKFKLIDKSQIQTILHDYLLVKKLCSCWIFNEDHGSYQNDQSPENASKF